MAFNEMTCQQDYPLSIETVHYLLCFPSGIIYPTWYFKKYAALFVLFYS